MSELKVSVPDTADDVTLMVAPAQLAASSSLVPVLVMQSLVMTQVPVRSPPQGSTSPHIVAPPTPNALGPLLPPHPKSIPATTTTRGASVMTRASRKPRPMAKASLGRAHFRRGSGPHREIG